MPHFATPADHSLGTVLIFRNAGEL
jgi:hypothetical protein